MAEMSSAAVEGDAAARDAGPAVVPAWRDEQYEDFEELEGDENERRTWGLGLPKPPRAPVLAYDEEYLNEPSMPEASGSAPPEGDDVSMLAPSAPPDDDDIVGSGDATASAPPLDRYEDERGDASGSGTSGQRASVMFLPRYEP